MTTELIIKLLMGVGMAVVFALKKRAQAQALRESRGESNVPPPKAAQGSRSDEQIRQVQEEIRRKIAARASRPQSTLQGPPTLPRGSQPTPAQRESDTRRAALAEKLRRAEQVVAVRSTPTESYASAPIESPSLRSARADTASLLPNPLTAELRDPVKIRRAIVLREILGPPIALR